MEASSNNPTIREVLTDALRYWEPRRIAYNAVLALVVLGSVIQAWPRSRPFVSLQSLLFLFVLAVLANVAYAAAYVVDVPVQLSGFRDRWKKWRWLLWIVGTMFAAVLAFYWMGDEVIGFSDINNENPNMEFDTFLVSTVTMLITAGALVFTILSFKKQLRLNFFADYTKRYQEIILGFPENINEPSFSLNRLPLDKRDRTLRFMRAYFDLCSEEYFLWGNGNLGDDVWREWEIGIRFALSKPAFKQAWAILRKDTIYQGNFAKFVEIATKATE